MDEQKPPQSGKQPVARGARACSTCRAAKMKCVGADDGERPCHRCKRANVECVFEKHRRGRKPGSKLSEASKMLRRLEKGLTSAKLRQEPQPPPPPPPLNVENPINNEDDDDDDHIFPARLINKETNRRNSFFRTILNPESDTPTHDLPQPPPSSTSPSLPSPSHHQLPRSGPTSLADPVSSGLIDEELAKILFDFIFLRLNPFINLFDPQLHSVNYVRSKCPFLFTTLLMAGCKFFRPELFRPIQAMAKEFAVRAFAEQWKSVEIVQAFACLTYWKDPDDDCTWTYIGYACRMAVELNLNRYVPHPPPNETEFQLLERRNRERTYLVLFIHDRSLSTQTGRHWMLPEDELVRHSRTWHEGSSYAHSRQSNTSTQAPIINPCIRPEDVIIAAFVELRRLAAETTEFFNATKTSNHRPIVGLHQPSIIGIGSNSAAPNNHTDMNYEVILHNCNSRLTNWADHWKREMQRAGGESFHFSFLSVFRLYVRLFLNSFGVQESVLSNSSGPASPSVQALSVCYNSAMDCLKIVYDDFSKLNMLRYCQETVTIMSAYSAVMLLQLLRSPHIMPQLHDGAPQEVQTAISKAADAFQDAAAGSPAWTSGSYHARFLRSLVTSTDVFVNPQTVRSRPPTQPPPPPASGRDGRMERDRAWDARGKRYEYDYDYRENAYNNDMAIDPRLHVTSGSSSSTLGSGSSPGIRAQSQTSSTIHSGMYPTGSNSGSPDHHTTHARSHARAASYGSPEHGQHQMNHSTVSPIGSSSSSYHYPSSMSNNNDGGGYEPQRSTGYMNGNGSSNSLSVAIPHVQHTSELDAQYYKNMFIHMGFPDPAQMDTHSTGSSNGISGYGGSTATATPYGYSH